MFHLFLYPLKKPENLWFSNVFKSCRNGTLASNELTSNKYDFPVPYLNTFSPLSIFSSSNWIRSDNDLLWIANSSNSATFKSIADPNCSRIFATDSFMLWYSLFICMFNFVDCCNKIRKLSVSLHLVSHRAVRFFSKDSVFSASCCSKIKVHFQLAACMYLSVFMCM